MKQRKCLIAGLPDAGKSTYLGALWYVINNDPNKDSFMLKASENNPPENVEQLVHLSNKWMRVEDMDRTSVDVSNNISFNLTPNEGGEDFVLNVPDFKGESIRQVITMNQPKEFDEWCESSDTLLFLMSDVKPGRFADDYYIDEDEVEEEKTSQQDTPSQESIPEFDPRKMPIASQNMLVLRFLAEKKQFSKVVICITAWDKVMSAFPNKSPEEYVREEAPALFNFVKYYFPLVMFFGLSAQGEEYNYEEYDGEDGQKHKRVTKECKTRLMNATRKGSRAFVVADKEKSFDITIPIAELLK